MPRREVQPGADQFLFLRPATNRQSPRFSRPQRPLALVMYTCSSRQCHARYHTVRMIRSTVLQPRPLRLPPARSCSLRLITPFDPADSLRVLFTFPAQLLTSPKLGSFGTLSILSCSVNLRQTRGTPGPERASTVDKAGRRYAMSLSAFPLDCQLAPLSASSSKSSGGHHE